MLSAPARHSLALLGRQRLGVQLSELRLQPRCLAMTSPGNYQLWLTLPETLQGCTAEWVTNELTAALQADPKSAYITQQGRLPGSVNVKPGKDFRTFILACEKTLMY